jgi:hypothetical protein
MKKFIGFVVSILIPAFIMAGGMASSAVAQEKAKTTKAEKGKLTSKQLLENDKVRVVEFRYGPGDESPNSARPARVIRALTAGTLMRTYADGKTEKDEYKTGEVKYFGADAAENKLKNLGKTDVVLFVVFLKEPKK